jgi:hypothetical protein
VRIHPVTIGRSIFHSPATQPLGAAACDVAQHPLARIVRRSRAGGQSAKARSLEAVASEPSMCATD